MGTPPSIEGLFVLEDEAVLSRVDPKAETPEFNGELALLYVREKAVSIGRGLEALCRERDGLTAGKRTPEFEEKFREYTQDIMKGRSETEIKAALRDGAHGCCRDLVLGTLDSVIDSQTFYNSLNIEMKRAGAKLGREDVGVEYVRQNDLKEALGLFLRAVVAYGRAYGLDLTLKEKAAVELSQKSIKKAMAESRIGYQ